jgi:flavin reductase (DIM6/NTAB) family NADH-FMN oxidoreductase RutF
MDRSEYFTVMAFDVAHSNVLNYMGRQSGRDGDKAKALGLHTAYTENGTPYYTEAEMVIECRIMYAAPFDPQYFKSDAPKNMYRNFHAGVHTMYIGEVVNAWRK